MDLIGVQNVYNISPSVFVFISDFYAWVQYHFLKYIFNSKEGLNDTLKF